jgi:hypothetical protein
MDAWHPKHAEDYDTIKWLWKWNCIKLVTLLWYITIHGQQNIKFVHVRYENVCNLKKVTRGAYNLPNKFPLLEHVKRIQYPVIMIFQQCSHAPSRGEAHSCSNFCPLPFPCCNFYATCTENKNYINITITYRSQVYWEMLHHTAMSTVNKPNTRPSGGQDSSVGTVTHYDCMCCLHAHWHNPSGHTTALELTQPLNRNEYQEYFLGGKGGQYEQLTTLSPSYTDCLEIWEPQPTGTLRACPGL